MEEKTYANVSWCVEDVLERAGELGIRVNKANAEALLRDHEKNLIGVMCSAGWDWIELTLLSGEYTNGRKKRKANAQ